MTTNPFALFEAATTEHELIQFQEFVRNAGFTAFRMFIDGFRDRLKTYEDAETGEIRRLLETAKRLFPEPREFSPSWDRIWEEYEHIVTYKQTVLETIPEADREGEWQILLDNPYTNADLVCYPNLSFMEGAYMYAYFRVDLKNNEYIRLQKIQNIIMAFGSERHETMEQSKDR